MKKFKKFFGGLFWLILNLLALAGCIRFFSEDLVIEMTHNAWIGLLLLIIGTAILEFSAKKLIENLFEKIKKPNKFLKRSSILFAMFILNIIASILIILSISTTFGVSADLFFAKILTGIFLIKDIWKLKKVLERIKKNRPVKYLFPYG